MESLAYPSTLPPDHRKFLDRAIQAFTNDPRILGVAAAGSFAEDSMDEFSDLDLVIAVDAAHVDAIMRERTSIAASLGPLLSAFTGEHVGELRLLICLYGDDTSLLHVDLKFVSMEDASARVDEPVVLWERDGKLTAELNKTVGRYPAPDAQWIEDRFWVWIHYATTKIGRGEYFEALEFLSFLRASVLSPLALMSIGERPSGVRRIERRAGWLARELDATVATAEATSLFAALRAAVGVYRAYRPTSVVLRTPAESATMRYLDRVESGVGGAAVT